MNAKEMLQAAQTGDAKSMADLALAYVDRTHGLEQNFPLGLKWIHESVRLECIDGITMLARAYLRGLYGLRKHHNQGYPWRYALRWRDILPVWR